MISKKLLIEDLKTVLFLMQEEIVLGSSISLYDAKDNRQVTRTHFKTTAVAIAKNLAQGKDITEKAMEFDVAMLKHYNDAMFYKHSIRKSTDPFKKEIREARLDIAIQESQRVRSLLDRFIFC
jgi:hypothetical protein